MKSNSTLTIILLAVFLHINLQVALHWFTVGLTICKNKDNQAHTRNTGSDSYVLTHWESSFILTALGTKCCIVLLVELGVISLGRISWRTESADSKSQSLVKTSHWASFLAQASIFSFFRVKMSASIPRLAQSQHCWKRIICIMHN